VRVLDKVSEEETSVKPIERLRVERPKILRAFLRRYRYGWLENHRSVTSPFLLEVHPVETTKINIFVGVRNYIGTGTHVAHVTLVDALGMKSCG
jgi:hypothetical protein